MPTHVAGEYSLRPRESELDAPQEMNHAVDRLAVLGVVPPDFDQLVAGQLRAQRRADESARAHDCDAHTSC